MPYGLDQPDNAARVQRLGTSRTLMRKHYSASRLTKALKALIEVPDYAARAAEIGRIMQLEDGIEVACGAMEKQRLLSLGDTGYQPFTLNG